MAPLKESIFMWRLSLDRLPTRLNLSKRGLDLQSIICPICSLVVESDQHLFFLAQLLVLRVWRLVACGVSFPSTSSIKEWIYWVNDYDLWRIKKRRLEVVVITTFWMIWKFRNSLVFDDNPISKSSIFNNIVLKKFLGFIIELPTPM